jgi:ATP-binding cassette subfamily B protein
VRPSLDPSKLPITLGGQFRRHVPEYVLGTAVLAAFQLSMNRIDWLSKTAIDLIFSEDPRRAIVPAATILALALVAFVTRVSSRWFIFNAGRDVEYELRAVLLDRLHRLGAAFYRTMSSGEIMSRSTGDLQQVRMLFGFGVLNIINVVFAFASALQVMTTISPRLTLASFVMLPLLVLVTRRFSKALFTRNRANQDALGRLSEMVQGNLAGVRVVRSFALETRELHRFRKANDEYLEASLGLARLRGSMQPLLGSIAAIGILVLFWLGGGMLLRGELTKGAFFAFWSALGRMMWPMIALGFSLAIVQRGRAGYARLKQIFDAEPEVVDGPNAAPAAIDGSLRVSGLSLSYGGGTGTAAKPAMKVLDDVSFEMKEGESLAIVGRTGSGKSTLAMLLARLLPTPKQTVFLGGHDVCDLPLAEVRRTIGYAQQDAFLFSTTVARNIGFAFDDPDSAESLQRVREAASEAQVLDEALGLPEGFDTVVGERGVQLSGGQKQRMALARALVWEPRILVLDDPLSAVDAKTERSILDAIERQAARRTVVLVTHRVAAAARCDRVIVLDSGKVIERGTHEELVKQGGLYAAFAEEQMMATELDDIDIDAVAGDLTPSAPAGGGAS